MKRYAKAALSGLLLAGAAVFMSAPARADYGVGFSFGDDSGYFNDPCDYYDYYNEPPPWGLPPDYCAYPVYSDPVYWGGYWYRGPIYYRWYGGERLFWLNGGWHRDEWRGRRPDIRWTSRGNGGWHGYNRGGDWNRNRGNWNHGGDDRGGDHNWNGGGHNWNGGGHNWSGGGGGGGHNWSGGGGGNWSGGGGGHNWSGGGGGGHSWSGGGGGGGGSGGHWSGGGGGGGHGGGGGGGGHWSGGGGGDHGGHGGHH